MFAFELEDFSAVGKKAPGPIETSHLAQATQEAKRQLSESGRYVVIDASGGAGGASERNLRNCQGREAAISMKRGADQVMLGVVTKISMTEYVVDVRVSDARTGKPVSSFTTDLRMGTGDSWPRGVRWLMKKRMLASQ